MIAAMFALYTIARVISGLETARKRMLREQDSALLEYLLNREFVICPDCRSMFEVSCLEEQMNTHWCCKICGCEFVECPHHVAKRGEL